MTSSKFSHFVDSVEKYATVSSKGINWVSMGAIVALMLLTAGDVIGRYLFSAPVFGGFEISQLFLVAAVLLGLGYAQAQLRHISIDILVGKLSPKGRDLAIAIFAPVMIAIIALVVWQSILYSIRYLNEHQVTRILGIPMYFYSIVTPIGFTFWAWQFTAYWLQSIKRLIDRRG